MGRKNNLELMDNNELLNKINDQVLAMRVNIAKVENRSSRKNFTEVKKRANQIKAYLKEVVENLKKEL